MEAFVVSGSGFLGSQNVGVGNRIGVRRRATCMVMEKKKSMRIASSPVYGDGASSDGKSVALRGPKPHGKTSGRPSVVSWAREEKGSKGGTKVANVAVPQVQIMYENAKSVEKRGDWRLALKTYNELLKMDPSNGKIYVRVSMLFRRLRKIDACRNILRRGLHANPTNAIIWQNWADIECKEGNVELARKLYKHALSANSRLHSIYNSWGSLEARLGNVAKARELLNKGLKFNPDNSRLLYSLGVLEDRQHNPELARRLLMRGLKLEPDNSYLHQALALVELKAHRVSNARECLRRATKVDPKNTMAWLTWAQLEELQGQKDVARRYYRIGSQINSADSITVWQSWARMEEKIGHDEDAIWIYSEAIASGFADALLYNEYGLLLRKIGRRRDALEVFRRGLGVDDHCSQLYKSIALGLVEDGSIEQARRVFSVGERKGIGRDVAKLLHAWAALEWQEQEKATAREIFQRAVKVDRTCGWLWMWFGRFELEEENFDLARHFFACSINADPRDGSAWRGWAELERKQGNEDRARFFYRRANELDTKKELYDFDPEHPLARCHSH